MSWWDSFKHAFALGGQDSPLTEDQWRVLKQVVQEVQRRNLVTPAIMYLEMSRPLANLSAQMMHYFEPLVSTFLDVQDYQVFAGILERRDAAELLIKQMESAE